MPVTMMRIPIVVHIVECLVNPQIITESSFGSTSKDEIFIFSILERVWLAIVIQECEI